MYRKGLLAFLPSLLLLSIFAATCSGQDTKSEDEVVEKPASHKLRNQKEDQQFRVTTETRSDKPSFRNGASNLLEINIDAVTSNGKLNAKSPIWAKLSAAVQDLSQIEKQNNLLHVRLFVSKKDIASLKSVAAIKAEVKKALADIDVYIVCVDVTVRNDAMTWNSFVKQK